MGMQRRSELEMNLFRAPPAARAAKTLDRALFARALPTTAACVRENKLISKYRKQLEKTKEMLLLDKFDPIASDPEPMFASQGKKCLVLKPEVKVQAPETWSSVLQEATKAGDLRVVPFDVTIGYELWSYLDVVRSILPEDLHGEIPVGFNTAGHVAHLNLRGQYHPYRHIIAQVIMDKNPGIRTVINKTDNVGTESEFRTFSYEVLAGSDNMLVEVSEAGCLFKFDYAKVYWNSKLGTEHQRVVSFFKPGEVVVDVMAGIGPFAVPAGKKGVFVWANDKNPESYKYLAEIANRNKVNQFVRGMLGVTNLDVRSLSLSSHSTKMATSSSSKRQISSWKHLSAATAQLSSLQRCLAACRQRNGRRQFGYPSLPASPTSS